ncbi:MAG: amidohydrolase family protein [Opitutaceae bacterium]|nr:amidohydrolase family protein [Opitutaceae bacterium]
MTPIDRRDFLKASLLAGAAASLASSAPAAAAAVGASPGIIDTNVNLFQWPFRRLKYADTSALVAKLKKHRIIEAWAGSFEALFHKDLSGVNERLASECRERGAGLLKPFGSVNLAWPDWEEEVRRCHEALRMPGLRIYPGYQPFDLGHPGFKRLLALVRERGLLLQIAFGMEDPRVHHPALQLVPVTVAPLLAALKAEPKAKVQLLHFVGRPLGADLRQLTTETSATIEFSRWEGNGAVGKLTGTAPDSTGTPPVPIDRVLFGSHAPFFPVETAILKLIESPFSTAQLTALMQGNARRLLG